MGKFMTGMLYDPWVRNQKRIIARVAYELNLKKRTRFQLTEK